MTLAHVRHKETVQVASSHTPTITIRYASAADDRAIARLAALDSARAPQGSVLLAEVDGEAHAALAVADDHAVADPFRPTAGIVALLRERAAQIRGAGRRPARGRRLIGRLATLGA
jgi:hypothetical protein